MNGVKGGARCVKLQGDKGGATTGLTFQYKTLMTRHCRRQMDLILKSLSL